MRTVLSDAFIRMCWKGGCGLWRWACQAWCLNLIRVFKIWLTGLGWGELRALPLTNTDINGICQWPARQKDGQDRGTKQTINNSWPPGGGGVVQNCPCLQLLVLSLASGVFSVEGCWQVRRRATNIALGQYWFLLLLHGFIPPGPGQYGVLLPWLEEATKYIMMMMLVWWFDHKLWTSH